jgi:hypothetical protein
LARHAPKGKGKYQMADKKTPKSARKPGNRAKPISGAIKPPRRGGTPPFIPTDHERKIAMLGKAVGLTHPQIARLITRDTKPNGISVDTLERHFPDELAAGEDRINMLVAGNLFNIATNATHKQAVTAAIFWLKCRMRWKPEGELPPIDIEGKLQRPAGQGGTEEAPMKFTIKIGERPDADD